MSMVTFQIAENVTLINHFNEDDTVTNTLCLVVITRVDGNIAAEVREWCPIFSDFLFPPDGSLRKDGNYCALFSA